VFGSLINKEQNLVSKQKLLLADDSVTIQKVVNLTFADEGIEVISVGDGDSAMEKILECSPDLIMVDVNMPGLNGYEICEKLRTSQTFRNTPVILLVGSFEPFDEEEAKRVGADDYLTKPFQSIRQLVQKVTTLLNAERTNGYVQPSEPIVAVQNTIEQFPLAEEKLADTLEDYHAPTETDSPKDETADFGDVSDDDGMIQTSQFPVFTTGEFPTFENDSNEPSDAKTELEKTEITPETSPRIEVINDEKEPETSVEHQPEIDEPTPYTPIEHDSETELKPYIPIETETENEPMPYVPVEHDMEIIGQKLDYEVMTVHKKPQVTTFESDSFIAQTVQPDENNHTGNDISLPEPASILTLDEQNLLEIAPREEDFIIDMDHEQNSSADWDFDTRSFPTPKAAEEPENTRDFAIISPIEEPTPASSIEKPAENEEIRQNIEESECVDLPAINTDPVDEVEDEPKEIVEEAKNIESDEVVEDSDDIKSDEVVEETDPGTAESEEIPANTETVKEIEEPKNDENVEATKNVVSVPSFIASTVVSEVAKEKLEVSEALIEVIVNRVMEKLSDNVVREIAWEIVPSHTDLIVKKMVQEKLDKD
jgi:CheY-like chemotaxis protein